MTLFDVEELTRYWIDHPPLHLMVAAYLGIGKERRRRMSSPGAKAAAELTPDVHVEQLLAELGPAFASGDVHAGLHPVVLDFTDLRRRARTTNCAEQD
jgi:hypothetical protein